MFIFSNEWEECCWRIKKNSKQLIARVLEFITSFVSWWIVSSFLLPFYWEFQNAAFDYTNLVSNFYALKPFDKNTSDILLFYYERKVVSLSSWLYHLQVYFLQMKINFLQMKINFLQMKINFLQMKINFLQMKINFLQMKINFLLLKINFLLLKINFLLLKINPLRTKFFFLSFFGT